MADFTTEKVIYLLNAKAYTEDGTVTKGIVKSHLPNEWQDKAEKIYTDLKAQKLIEPTTKDGKPTSKDGRFSVTEEGLNILITNLAATDYKFTSSKGYKVLNALLDCIKESAEVISQVKPTKEMTFEEFEKKFKALYFEERRQQELKGPVAIYSKKLLQKFAEQNPISKKTLNIYFELLKTNRKIFTVTETKDEMMEWGE